MKALISDIKRFAVHDGNGIRTTIFFKGCPLKCLWCHNPESIDANPQIAVFKDKCINCGECVKTCDNNAHEIVNYNHQYNKDNCNRCGSCEDVCFTDAIKLYGKYKTVDELVDIVLTDIDFYKNSGGGVTLSGGECLLYADFCSTLLKKLKSYNINTAIDTCGYISRDSLDKIIPYTDIFLYDLKAIDEDVHIKCTGKSNKIILENLNYLNSLGKKIEIRIPYVPGFNDSQMHKIYDYIKNLKNVFKVKILPYHNYAGNKYNALMIKNTLPEKTPTDAEMKSAEMFFKNINQI